jgi:acyl carrier protein
MDGTLRPLRIGRKEKTMNGSADPMVRHLLARRLGTAPERILGAHDLAHDLGIDPLDLVLVALDLEEVERDEFPIAKLETVRTVDDLSRLVCSWQNARPRAQRRPLPASVTILRRRLRRATRGWRHDDTRRRVAR